MDSNSDLPEKLSPPERSWLRKFADAFRGLGFALRTQSSLHAHVAATVAVVAVGCFLPLNRLEWSLLAISVGGVLVAELLNTAVERLAKSVTEEFHPHIRDALDIGSAAVLVAAFTAVVIGLLVLLPHLL